MYCSAIQGQLTPETLRLHLLTLIRPKQLRLWKILCQLCRSCGLQENGAVRPEPLNPINPKPSTLNPQPSTLNRSKLSSPLLSGALFRAYVEKMQLNSIPRGSLTTLKKGSSENPQSIYTGFSLNPKPRTALDPSRTTPP